MGELTRIMSFLAIWLKDIIKRFKMLHFCSVKRKYLELKCELEGSGNIREGV